MIYKCKCRDEMCKARITAIEEDYALGSVAISLHSLPEKDHLFRLGQGDIPNFIRDILVASLDLSR